MDDNTINVLRRSGSWKKVSLDKVLLNKEEGTYIKSDNLSTKEDIEGLSILASTIKDSFKNKNPNTSIKYNTASKRIEPASQIISNKSKNLLPLLRKLDSLAEHRTSLGKNITAIDKELSSITKEIENIKISFQEDIDKINCHIKLYDNSLSIINKLKGEIDYDSN